jgi:hypothetical protein
VAQFREANIHAAFVMFEELRGGLKIRGALTAREQSPQQNNRMQPEAQRSKKGAPRPLAKLLIHHDSWAARWAFLNQMRLLKNSPEIMELPWNGYCGRPFGSFCSSGLDSVQLCYFR